MKPMNWLYLALVTVACWGLYGIFLHQGQVAMADKELGRYKAFLFVGIAYFLTAVLAPLAILLMSKNMDWNMPPKGMWISLFAGILGAIGAFFVLLAMGSGAKSGMNPGIVAVSVMSIVFAGAPIVNAVVGIIAHPPKGGFTAIPPLFILGILLAALGGFMVTKFKPGSAPPPPPARTTQP
jgi:drug/metabolite transporter (DMT)-like permease